MGMALPVLTGRSTLEPVPTTNLQFQLRFETQLCKKETLQGTGLEQPRNTARSASLKQVPRSWGQRRSPRSTGAPG